MMWQPYLGAQHPLMKGPALAPPRAVAASPWGSTELGSEQDQQWVVGSVVGASDCWRNWEWTGHTGYVDKRLLLWEHCSLSCLTFEQTAAPTRASLSLSARGSRSRNPFPCQTHAPRPTAGQHERFRLTSCPAAAAFGGNRCFSCVHWIPSHNSPAGVCPGFSCAGVWPGCSWAGLGGNLPLKPYRHPAPACAPLRHCPTKSSAAVIHCYKKNNTQAVHAGSSSACNDCWVMDLHGDNFELLSALKPCSLLCAGNEMCWLPLPGSRLSLLSLAGARPGSGATPAAQQCWAGLGF